MPWHAFETRYLKTVDLRLLMPPSASFDNLKRAAEREHFAHKRARMILQSSGVLSTTKRECLIVESLPSDGLAKSLGADSS